MHSLSSVLAKLQDQCVRCGAVPRLVSLLFRFPERPLLEEACLLALCNLSGLGLSEGGVAWERGVSMRSGECNGWYSFMPPLFMSFEG